MLTASAKNKYKHANSPEHYLHQRLEVREGSDCYWWKGGVDKDGYGQCQSSKYGELLKVSRAHQMMYVTHKGSIPEGMIVCHTCDNPSCCNINHLFLGTWNDNVQDMITKKRYKHPRYLGLQVQKLSEEDYDKIRTYKGKLNCFKVAKLFNISFSRVCQIWRGEYYDSRIQGYKNSQQEKQS